MADNRLIKAIEALARVQGGLSGAAEALSPHFPKAASLMDGYADDVKVIGDLLMEVGEGKC